MRYVRAQAVAVLLSSALLLGACASGGLSAAQRYDAEVVRTEYGIPHVRARDFGSLGYGLGHAFAQDNFCLLAEKILQVNGERSKHFGPDSPAHVGVSGSVRSLASDFFYRSQYDKAAIALAYQRGSAEVRDMTAGYAAGVNRYLRETGAANLPAPCRGAAWVRPITEEDLYLWYASVATLAGNQNFVDAIVDAAPPAAASRSEGPAAPAIEAPAERSIGSNAWAFGKDTTADGRGLLWGNPHWPWGNANRFYQAHLTVPGKLDVMGAAYAGLPGIVIGFNKDMAWSHTVSTGQRFVIRELKLVPGAPTAYLVDGQRREMQPRVISVEVRRPDGSVGTETRTLYSTEFGPVTAARGFGWTDTTAYALTDINLANQRMVEQWLRIGQAKSVGEVRRSLAAVLGVPWVNTLAADRAGATLYADYSAKPYVTDARLQACADPPNAKRALEGGVVVLDGSRSQCGPETDPATPQAGLMPARLLPVLERTDYVANSNNTYWLTNPKAPITGLPSVNGRAETDPGPRAQAGLRDIESRLAGRDGLAGSRFDAEAVKALVFGSQAQPDLGNRVRAAEMMAPGLGDICRDATPVAMAEGPAVDIGEACRVLAAWDRRSNTASVGAHVFREFWTAARRTPNLWRRAFDPRNPLETPAEPRTDDPVVRTALRQALGGAVRRLAAAGIPLDRPWGELQFQDVKGAAVPLYGDQGEMGVLNAMAAGPPAKGRYGPVIHGASYVQLVGFDARGPVAESVLLYGQSSDPASPHYFDQLPELWAKRRWAPMPFTAAQRERARVLSRVRLTE